MARFNQRLEGLAQSQELMLRQNWQGAWMTDLVRAHLELFGAQERTKIAGPPIFLVANAVQNLGYALHELATNASKHGALSILSRLGIRSVFVTANTDLHKRRRAAAVNPIGILEKPLTIQSLKAAKGQA